MRPSFSSECDCVENDKRLRCGAIKQRNRRPSHRVPHRRQFTAAGWPSALPAVNVGSVGGSTDVINCENESVPLRNRHHHVCGLPSVQHRSSGSPTPYYIRRICPGAAAITEGVHTAGTVLGTAGQCHQCSASCRQPLVLFHRAQAC